jgi:hypothetical protein
MRRRDTKSKKREQKEREKRREGKEKRNEKKMAPACSCYNVMLEIN